MNSFLRSRRRMAVVIAIFAVAILGSLAQAGVLVPNVNTDQDGGDQGNYMWLSVENASWRSWHVDGLHVASLVAATHPSDEKRVRLALIPYEPSPMAAFGKGTVKALRVSAGHTFYVEAFVPMQTCTRTDPLSSPRLKFTMDFSTPFGDRWVPVTVGVSCMVPPGTRLP